MSAHPDHFSGYAVLVAEDDPTIRTLMLEVLAMLGVHAEGVADGKLLLDRFAQGDFDLVLMDCRMPEVDGFEATRAIRAGQAGPEVSVPIVALTANLRSIDQAKCREAGMDDCLPKPLEIKAIEKILGKWLPPTLDESQLRLLPPGDLKQKLVQKFLGDLPVAIAEMKQAHGRRDRDTVGRLAHRLKSSSLTLGATSLSRACEELEAACDAGLLPQGELLLARIEHQAKRSIRALTKLAA